MKFTINLIINGVWGEWIVSLSITRAFIAYMLTLTGPFDSSLTSLQNLPSWRTLQLIIFVEDSSLIKQHSPSFSELDRLSLFSKYCLSPSMSKVQPSTALSTDAPMLQRWITDLTLNLGRVVVLALYFDTLQCITAVLQPFILSRTLEKIISNTTTASIAGLLWAFCA